MTRWLVLNAGSSSLKFALYADDGDERIRGSISGIGHRPRLRVRSAHGGTEEQTLGGGPVDMDGAAELVFDRLESGPHGSRDISAIGHRIVHGGRRLTGPARLDGPTLDYLSTLEPLAPLHQPYNLAIVAASARRFPGALQVGAFDTAFHAGRPAVQKLYGLPRSLIDDGIIAYGFHGLSFEAIADRLTQRFGPDAGGRVLVLHLGSGSSLCAMQGGRSVATTMGFSPLDGPVMATRCGAIDPGVLLHLVLRKGMAPDAVEEMLYRRSGLAGLAGLSGDMQELMAAQTPQSREALDYFALTVCRQIGALTAALEGVDRIVFTAGIGENSPAARAMVARRLGWLGVSIDEAANEAGAEDISSGQGPALHVVATDEERMVAHAIAAVIDGA